MKVHPMLVTATLVLAACLPVAQQAAAADDPSAEVCTVGGIAVPDGQAMPEDIPLVMSCFASVAEAEAFLRAGAPGDREQLPQASASAHFRATAATVTIGRVWTGISRSGSELIHWGTGTGCNGVTYGFPSLPAGWNDNIRSAEGSSNCWASHYEHNSYGGQVLTCAPYCASLGFLAEKSSSIVYRPVGTFG